MRRVRIAFVAAAIACAGAAAAPACKTPSQVELDVSITNAHCKSDVRSTAITVGVDPDKTENSLAQGYVTATTSNCDDVTVPNGILTGHVGTLVVTPSDDSSNASIVVTAAFGGGDSTMCKPPLYTHCVVARRRFTFVDHQKLSLPIALDISCLDVPCDEVSTCQNGKCVLSDVTPSGDGFGQPTTPHDAGSGNGNDGGGNDGGGTDGGTTDSGSDGGATLPTCQNDGLHCANKSTGLDTTCNGAVTPCCDSPAGVATCGGACTGSDHGWCCSDADCQAPGYRCSRPMSGGAPGKCLGQTTCSTGTLYCNGAACDPGKGCCTTPFSATPECSTDCSTAASCCSNQNCPTGTCPPVTTTTPQTCQGTGLQPGPPTCSGAILTCGGRTCEAPDVCCAPSDGGVAVCRDGGTCLSSESQDCCSPNGTQCISSGTTCGTIMITPGAGNLLPSKPLTGVGAGGGLSTCH